jgi:hypothetical protein
MDTEQIATSILGDVTTEGLSPGGGTTMPEDLLSAAASSADFDVTYAQIAGTIATILFSIQYTPHPPQPPLLPSQAQN